MVHPRRQTPQGESVTRHGAPQLIMLSLVYIFDITEVHFNWSNPFFGKKARLNV